MTLRTAQTLVPFGSERGEVWRGRGRWHYLWYGYYRTISIFRLTKMAPLWSQKRGTCSEVLFFLLASFSKCLCVFFPEILVLFLQSHSWIRKNDLLLVSSHPEAGQLIYFSFRSYSVFPRVLVGSPCCEKLYTYIFIIYMCIYIYVVCSVSSISLKM